MLIAPSERYHDDETLKENEKVSTVHSKSPYISRQGPSFRRWVGLKGPASRLPTPAPLPFTIDLPRDKFMSELNPGELAHAVYVFNNLSLVALP